MARKPAEKEANANPEIPESVRKAAVASQISHKAFIAISAAASYHEVVEAIRQNEKNIDEHNLDFLDADLVFRCLKMCLDNPFIANERYDDAFKSALTCLESEATGYLIERIAKDTKDGHIGDILVEMERLLEDKADVVSSYFRAAAEEVRKGCEKQIERLRKRVRIREDLKMLDGTEPNAAGDSRNDEYDPVKRGLNRRLAMMLLDALAPQATKAAKAELLFLLSGFDAEKARQFWSRYKADRPLDKLDKDEKTVASWEKKLRIQKKEISK